MVLCNQFVKIINKQIITNKTDNYQFKKLIYISDFSFFYYAYANAINTLYSVHSIAGPGKVAFDTIFSAFFL